MKTFVCFDTGGGSFAVPVESTTGVRAADGIVALPGSRVEVVGILPGEPPITVLSTLGVGRDHILLLTVDEVSFGLFVQEVTGVLGVEESDIGPPPHGQNENYIVGTLRDHANLVLLADPRVLASRL